MRLGDKTKDSRYGRSIGDAEDVRVSERIAQQRLEAGTGHGERCSDNDGENDAGKADILNDQAVVTGNLAALAEEHAQQVAPKRIERNRDSAEFQGEDDYEKQNHRQDEALEKEFAEG